jgi:hypothetical protein
MAAISASKRHNVFMKTFYHCGYCGKVLIDNDDLTIDHKNPKAKGGTDEMNNLVGCCKSCNQMKADRTVEEYRKELSKAANMCNAFSGERYNPNIQFFFEKYTMEDLIAKNNSSKQSDMDRLTGYVDYIAKCVDNLAECVDNLSMKIDNKGI